MLPEAAFMCKVIFLCQIQFLNTVVNLTKNSRYKFFFLFFLIKAECHRACDVILCGRNAECKADDHTATCSCKHGFFGNAKDDKIGCQPIECEVNDDCTQEKICDSHRCRIACLAHNPCGVNAICTTEKHVQVIISLH